MGGRFFLEQINCVSLMDAFLPPTLTISNQPSMDGPQTSSCDKMFLTCWTIFRGVFSHGKINRLCEFSHRVHSLFHLVNKNTGKNRTYCYCAKSENAYSGANNVPENVTIAIQVLQIKNTLPQQLPDPYNRIILTWIEEGVTSRIDRLICHWMKIVDNGACDTKDIFTPWKMTNAT